MARAENRGSKPKPREHYRATYFFTPAELRKDQRDKLPGIVEAPEFADDIARIAGAVRGALDNAGVLDNAKKPPAPGAVRGELDNAEKPQAPTPADVRATLEQITRQLDALTKALAAMDDRTRDALDDMRQRLGLPDSFGRIETALAGIAELNGLAKKAQEAAAAQGRPHNVAQHFAAYEVAGVLRGAGVKLTQTKGGAFFTCTKIVFEAAGLDGEHAAQYVRAHMEWRNGLKQYSTLPGGCTVEEWPMGGAELRGNPK